MTTTTAPAKSQFVSFLIKNILSIKPLAEFAKAQARNMMIKRGKKIGVNWHENVERLSQYDWKDTFAKIQNPDLEYPEYYVCSFHAYEKGNLSWEAAWEVESASYSVHSQIYSKTPKADGDSNLRKNYHKVLKETITSNPQDILDIGCSVGLSTFALKDNYPEATITGLDLSPYYIAVANYNSEKRRQNINWIHGMGEKTGLPENSFDLVSSSLTFHELPQSAAKNIFQEAKRLLRPNGYFTMVDMNPQSEVYKNMPPYIFTLLKSTEPYLDQYFTLDIEQELMNAGFEKPSITEISPRHRAIVAKLK